MTCGSKKLSSCSSPSVPITLTDAVGRSCHDDARSHSTVAVTRFRPIGSFRPADDSDRMRRIPPGESGPAAAAGLPLFRVPPGDSQPCASVRRPAIAPVCACDDGDGDRSLSAAAAPPPPPLPPPLFPVASAVADLNSRATRSARVSKSSNASSAVIAMSTLSRRG